VSDNDANPAASQDTIPGAWPTGPSSPPETTRIGVVSHSHHRRRESASASGHNLDSAKRHEKGPKLSKPKPSASMPADHTPSSPAHRSPRQVMSDLVHPKRSNSQSSKQEPSSSSASPAINSDSIKRDPRTANETITKPAKSYPPKVMTLPDIKVERYRTRKSSPNSSKPPESCKSHTVRSTTPTTPIVTSPQSSPSQYSQDEDDAPSEGTVSSDEDARSLLAQADSGPRRVAPLMIRKKSKGIDQERVDRARQLMSGDKAR
jgi:hypothetical protein